MAQVKQTQVDRVQSQSNLLKGDPYLINRIVGHHEYTQALRRLERFVRSATEVELVAAEHIVRDEPQYQVYSLYGKQAKDKDDNQDKEKYAYDRDPGLARLMALARVELGAMLAGFAKLRSPFEAVAATPYDMEPFKEFVFEGARRQFEVLQQDTTFQPEFPPTKRSLAYMRRLNIARHFAVAAAVGTNYEARADRVATRESEQDDVDEGAGEDELGSEKLLEYPRNPDVRATVLAWMQMKAKLDSVYEPFFASVYSYVNAMRSQTTGTNSRIVEQTIEQCLDGNCREFPVVETPVTRANGVLTRPE